MYKLAINRPIATLMYAMTLIIFGLMSFQKMSVSLYPNVDFPIVTIKTIYPGAQSDTIETQVTNKIEEAISQIGGIDSIRSTSANGISVVIAKFFLSRDISEATNDVRDKVSAVILPKDARTPLVSKLDIGAAPVINIFITAKNDTIAHLMEFVDKKAKPTLQKINGVGAINIIGYKDRQIKIFPDIDKLNKYNITINELNKIIQTQNIKLNGGKIINNKNEYILKIKADSLTLRQLANIKINNNIKLKDVATIKDSLSDPKSYSALNQTQGVMLQIQKISGTNTIQIVKQVKKTIPYLQSLANNRFHIQTLQDTTTFIINSLDDVKFDLIYGAILAIIIIFVFLRNFTITFVSALAIPTSILGTFALMASIGYDLNKLTLIGLTLSIGIIIDDAIVVVENIYKKLESNMSKFQAALYGVQEMAFAIFAISAMLLAVFVPVANMSGIVGKFFESFAMTVVFAIIISYTIAMSLIPSFSARVIEKKQSWFYDITENFFVLLDKVYAKILSKILKFKFLTIILIIAVFIGSLSLFPKIGVDFLPKEDKSEFEVKIKAQAGISLENMILQTKKIQQVLKNDKDVVFTTLNIGYTSTQEKNKALIYVKLIPKDKRVLNQEQEIQKFRKKLLPFKKDFFITAAAIPNIKGAGATVPYQIVLKSDNFKHLQIAKTKLVNYLKAKKGFVDIDTNLDDPKPQYDITINRLNASKYGISALQIASAINTAFSSDIEISYFEQNGQQYDITLRIDDKQRENLDILNKIQLRTNKGKLIYLSGLITISKSYAQATINHYDRQRQVTIYSDLFGLDLGSAVNYTKAKLDQLLPKDVTYKFTGFAEEMVKTNKAFATAIGLSMILMFIILAVLYESLIQPIIIMVALPLSIIGVLVALYLSGLHFSLFVMIGFMLLMGMVGKNAVLLVDFANIAMQNGKNSTDALIEAGEKRLRPILMTTFAMIFAMLPLALGTGLGCETKAPMSIAIIGGLISSTILTLFIVPAIYKLIVPIDMWLRKFYEVGRVE